MVTKEEIGQVPLFAALDAAQREQLSRLAADVSLVAGEYAAHQGGERALRLIEIPDSYTLIPLGQPVRLRGCHSGVHAVSPR